MTNRYAVNFARIIVLPGVAFYSRLAPNNVVYKVALYMVLINALEFKL